MKHVSSKTESNKAVIMELVRKLGPLSRVKIHQLTQLRPSTISVLSILNPLSGTIIAVVEPERAMVEAFMKDMSTLGLPRRSLRPSR